MNCYENYVITGLMRASRCTGGFVRLLSQIGNLFDGKSYTVIKTFINMEQDKKQFNNKKAVRNKNAGSATFNQGSEQDPDYNKRTKVSEEENKNSHTPLLEKEKVNPRDGNIGKNNAGGYE